MNNELETYQEYTKRLEREYSKRRYYYNKANHPEIIEARKSAKNLLRNPGMHLHHWSYRVRHYNDVIELTVSDHKYIHSHLVYDNAWCCYKTKAGKRLASKKSHLEFINQLIENRNKFKNRYKVVTD